jgi:rhodanese-related sulfurtransferase
MPTQGVTKAGPVLGQPFLSTPKYYASQNQPAVIQRHVVADPNFSNHGGVGWAAPLASVVSFLVATYAGYLWQSRKHQSGLLVEPLAMASTAALTGLRPPTEAKNLWTLRYYTLLDLRSEQEQLGRSLRSGKYREILNIPLFNVRAGTQEPNPKWIEQVKAALPSADAKILVMCSDGRSRTQQAMDLLAAEGYRTVAGVQGGYNKWDMDLDRWLFPRSPGAQRSRASALVDPVEWKQWAAAVGRRAPVSSSFSSAPTSRNTAPPQYASVGSSSARPASPPPPPARPSGSPVSGTPSWNSPGSSIPKPSSWSAAPVSGSRPPPPSRSDAPPPGAYNDPAFQSQTLAAFPAKANATVEEARVLWEQGNYSILDLRSEMEGREGRIRSPNKGSVDIPMFHAKSSYDSVLGKKIVSQEPNTRLLEEVRSRFPDKNANIVVMCSDGTTRSSQALDLLAAEGYRNIVLMRGGYNRWDQVFDARLAQRTPAQQASKAEWLDDPIRWGTWSNLVGVQTPAQRTVTSSAAPAARTTRAVTPAGDHQDPAFQAATIAAFPAKANATVEEARVLWKLDGYSILDVRSEAEGRESGRIRGPNKGSIDIPMFNSQSVYDAALGRKVTTQEVNPRWLEEVKARFPNRGSKIIVMCSDGTTRSSQALDLLAAEGYRNLVLMRGGYNRWDQVYDAKLATRNPTQMAAKAEWLDDPVEWGKWSTMVGLKAPAQRTVSPSAAPATRTLRPVEAVGAYLDPAFQAATIAAFPAKANATVEEARVLWKQDGYSILDVRSEMEGRDGRIRGPNKGSIDIPMFNAKSSYDSVLGKKVVTQEPNPRWLEEVRARFPDKNSKLIVVCSDGTTRSSQALDILAGEGYRNLVLMRGGYNRWDQVFDVRLALRSPNQQAAKADWLDDPVEWGTWTTMVGIKVPSSRPVSAAAAPSARTVRQVQGDENYQDPAFQAATIAAFPAKGYATVDEARVLWKQGDHTLVDIRSDMEGRESGRVRGSNKGSVDIPLFNARSTYDSYARRKVVTAEPNREWLKKMNERFPDRDSKILLMCSDGSGRAPQAARLLSRDGYWNIAVMAGGYNAWDQRFDKRLQPRTPEARLAKELTLPDPVKWGQY